jgi:hypothetical protein
MIKLDEMGEAPLCKHSPLLSCVVKRKRRMPVRHRYYPESGCNGAIVCSNGLPRFNHNAPRGAASRQRRLTAVLRGLTVSSAELADQTATRAIQR